MADFSSSGKHPEDMDELMIAVIIGSSWSIHFFRSHVGIGSRSQVLSGGVNQFQDVSQLLISHWWISRLGTGLHHPTRPVIWTLYQHGS